MNIALASDSRLPNVTGWVPQKQALRETLVFGTYINEWTFPGAHLVKNPFAMQETQVRSLIVRTIPWRRAGQPTLVFLPGESHGQRSLVGHSP